MPCNAMVVLNTLIIVINVLVTELIQISVIVHQDSMMIWSMLSVQNVTVNVLLVIIILFVELVPVLELWPQNVPVQLVGTNLLPYLLVMIIVPINMVLMMEPVLDVPQDVLNVLNSHIVKSVKLILIDYLHLNVLVKMDSGNKFLKMVKLMICVDLVYTNVLPALMIKVVLPVNQVELTHQSVSVLMVNTMMVILVKIVLLNV